MPIKVKDEQHLVLDDPKRIRLYQLLCARKALQLEQAGMRHSRLPGGARGAWAKHYGLPLRSKHQVVIDRLEEEINLLRQEINDERDRAAAADPQPA